MAQKVALSFVVVLFAVLGVEVRASCMLSKHSKLHPQLFQRFLSARKKIHMVM